MLTIEPMDGLCNRMGAIDSAIALSKVLDLPLRLIWTVDRTVGCRFDRLFEMPEEIVGYRIEDKSSRTGRARRKLRRTLLGKPKPDIDQPFFKPGDTVLDRHEYFAGLRGTRRLHIRTWSRFFVCERPFAVFRPRAGIRAEVDRAAASFDRTWGVHIRRTDHEVARAISPTEAFVERMQAAVADGRASTFFLATDDPREEEALRHAFPAASSLARSAASIAPGRRPSRTRRSTSTRWRRPRG